MLDEQAAEILSLMADLSKLQAEISYLQPALKET